MRRQEEAVGIINSRIRRMKAGELSVLFLISVSRQLESGEEAADEDRSGIKRRMDEILSRFFRDTDVVGELDDGRFIVFISGKITEKEIREKAGTLSDVLRLAGEELQGTVLSSYMGVFVFEDCTETFQSILKPAERAVDIARREEEKRCHISTDPSMLQERFAPEEGDLSVQTLLTYIDEGARLIETGEKLKTIYAGPGFYSRVAANTGADIDQQYAIHPDDQEAYDGALREAAAGGRSVECRYRIRGVHTAWIPCSVRVVKVSSGFGDSPVVLEISHDISGLEKLEDQYGLCREWLDFVLKRSDVQLWDVDVRTRTLRLLQTYGQPEGNQSIYRNFPESLIESGKIHRECAERFREFAGRMLEGNGEDSGNFIVQLRNSSSYAWCSMSYRMIFDKDGRPSRAIGIKKNLYDAALGGSLRRTIPEAMYPDLYCYLQADLTQDRVEKLQLEGRSGIGQDKYRRYTDIMRLGVSKVFSKDDELRLHRRFRRKKLMEEYADGRRWILEKCRVVDGQGSIRWISLGVNLIRDEETGDINLFAYLCFIGRRRRLESAIPPSALRESSSGLYAEWTLRAIADVLVSRGGEKPYALSLIRMEGLREALDGEQKRQKKEAIETAFRVALGENCLAGRHGEDGIAVFFAGGQTKLELRRRLESAIAFVRLSMADLPEMGALRFIVGTAGQERASAGYDLLLSRAEVLCRIHEGQADDVVVFHSDEEKSRWEDIKLNETDLADAQASEARSSSDMSEEEKDVALECLELLLQDGGKGSQVEGVLAKLGSYYGADRAYVLTYTESGKVVTMLYEWYRDGKHSIQQMISGKRLYDFPLLMRCATMGAPVFFSQEAGMDRVSGMERSSWRFSVFPLKWQDDTYPFLCMENPTRNTERTALISRMVEYLGIRGSRPYLLGREEESKEKMLAMPNLRSYMDVVYSLDSDMYSSMGALTVDIPRFPDINNWKGYEYGSKFLLRISEVLSDVFGKGLLFHTQEAEFVVLCANTTYEVFYARCSRVQILLRQQYSRQFRMGFTWSDGVFSAKDLVGKARSIMDCDNSFEREEQGLAFVRDGLRTWEHKPGGSSGSFLIYLQPKINMQTGELVGAEALARIADENGALLPHGQIIDRMEKEGTIRELDYFVFDKVLSTLSRWKAKGYKDIRISSNFSRKTLLNPSALASLLAILSRYPDVSQDMVELEITETAGDFENNTLSELIEHFGKYGLQFSLDDFGSRYSNMSMLADIRFHSVKLDRSIIRGVADNQVSQMMVKDIVRICDSCGMICIAEGVETQTQVEELLKDGCTYAQGYFYDRPMPVREFEREYLIQGEKGDGWQ